jgi:predicted anti-sigma-YlaC factor YlaD
MNRYYVEPIGWLLVCLLIMLIAVVTIASLSVGDSQSPVVEP